MNQQIDKPYLKLNRNIGSIVLVTYYNGIDFLLDKSMLLEVNNIGIVTQNFALPFDKDGVTIIEIKDKEANIIYQNANAKEFMATIKNRKDKTRLRQSIGDRVTVLYYQDQVLYTLQSLLKDVKEEGIAISNLMLPFNKNGTIVAEIRDKYNNVIYEKAEIKAQSCNKNETGKGRNL